LPRSSSRTAAARDALQAVLAVRERRLQAAKYSIWASASVIIEK
jgi:hypothetical protein